MSRSRCIIVLGVHGSGTSAVAGVLHHLGCSMGKRTRGPHPTNPRGHYEDIRLGTWIDNLSSLKDEDKLDQDLINFKEYLFERADTNRLWGLKDPRLSVKFDLIYDSIPQDWRVICVERNELAAARSAANKWGRNDVANIISMQDTIRECRALVLENFKPPALWVNFNNMTEKPELYVRKMANFIYEGIAEPLEEQVAEAVRFIDPSLNHKREEHSHA